MEEGRQSTTAIMAAIMRAAHGLLDDEPKILRDDLALGLSGLENEAALRAALETMQAKFVERIGPDLTPSFVRYLCAYTALRNRYAEDELGKAIARGVKQYVILGAGLDSFAYCRQNPSDGIRIFEVDYPATQQWKRTRLHELGVDLPSNLTLVPLDFEKRRLIASLHVEGYRPQDPTFFSWLGVVPYLTKEAIFTTLREIAVAASGSEVVFDYMLPSEMLTEEARQVWALIGADIAARGEPLYSFFAPDSLAARVKELGFAQVWNLSGEEAFARYWGGHTERFRNLHGMHFLKARVGN